MTNKTEDRFYFGKPVQPERFARDHDMKMIAFRDRFFRSYGEAIREAANNPDSRSAKSDDAVLRTAWSAMFQTGYADAISVLNGLSAFMKSKASVAAMKKAANDAMAEYAAHKRAALAELGKLRSSRPGQPERFSSIMDEIASAEDAVYDGRDVAGVAIQELLAKMRRGLMTEEEKKYFLEVVREAKAYGMYSRPGQPDKFDASSLDRGNFADASKSPMLGKLLSEKAMPDGGWRAVQVGSDTLVISFEDADLARDFGRRVASKGYSATSPVATTGRYWNVEVKNGK
jgi:hypothetical protein